jgi:predicted MFS family arabinose efflux permease
MPAPSIFRPLEVRDFRLLWSGQTISLLGSGIFTVTLAWQTIKLSSNPAALSVVLLALGGPEVLLALVGGAVTDRLPRRTVMLVSDAIRMIVLAALAVLAGTGRIEIWHLVALGLVYGSATAFFEPAVYSIYTEVLSPELLLEATALRATGAIFSIELLGPALGGVLVATTGTAWAFGADAVSFGVSLATLLLVSVRTAPPRERASESVLSDVREGFRYVRSVRWLWISIAMTAISNVFFSGPLRVAIPVLVKETLRQGAGALGIATGSLGAGGLVALLLVTRFGKGPRRTHAMYASWVMAGFAMASAGVFPRLAVVAAGMAGVGLFLSFGNTIWLTLVQELVPKHVMGRVFSMDMVISQGLIPLSIAASGPIVGLAGPGTTLVVGGLLAAGTTAFAATRRGALTPTA